MLSFYNSRLSKNQTQVNNKPLYKLDQLKYLYRQSWQKKDLQTLRSQINLKKIETINHCFSAIHNFNRIIFKKFRTQEQYKILTIQDLKSSLVYLDYVQVINPDYVLFQQTQNILKDYLSEYNYLKEVTREYSQKKKQDLKSKINVQYFFDLNGYVFLAARKLLLHLKIDLEQMMKVYKFKQSKQRITQLHNEKITEVTKYLLQRLNHARDKAEQSQFLDKIQYYAKFQSKYEYSNCKTIFNNIRNIRDNYIKRIRQDIQNMLENKQICEQNLILYCDFIGKLEGPKCKNSQFLLFELEHLKTIFHLYKIQSYKKQYQEFLLERVKQISAICMIEMKFKVHNSKNPKLYINTHGFRFDQLNIKLEQMFKCLNQWRINQQLGKILYKSDRKQKQIMTILQIQQGFGKHTNKDQLTILTALKRFKQKSLRQSKSHYSVQFEEIIQEQNKDILKVKIYFTNLFDFENHQDFPTPEQAYIKQKENISTDDQEQDRIQANFE